MKISSALRANAAASCAFSLAASGITFSVNPLVLSAALLSASAAFAQTSLAPVIVTAARTPQAARDVLGDTLVITAEDIAASGHRSLTDLLQTKRGFEITRNGGPGSAASVFIRGAANYQSLVLIDGVRAGSATLGGATWESIPLSQIDRIEVVYGPQSSLYGADAIGGVVQIFTRQGAGPARVNAALGFGSDGLRTIDAGIAGSTSPSSASGSGEHAFRYAIQANRERVDGFSSSLPSSGSFTYNPDRDGYRKHAASANFGLNLLPGQDLGLVLLNSKIKAQFDAGADVDDRTEQELASYALNLRSRVNEQWTSLIQVGRSEDKGKTFASYGDGVINSRQDQTSWQNDLTIAGTIVQLIAERRVEKVDSDTVALVRERSTNSFAASWHVRQAEHLFSVAARSDDNSQFGRHTTGSAEYGYRFAPRWRMSASAGTSFRAPTFNELYYPGYGIATNQPEQGRHFELGVNYDAGAVQFSAAAYRNRLRDLLVYAPVCPVEVATHPFGCAYNVNKATLPGLSLAGAIPFGAWRFKASLDLQNPTDDTTGKRLARRAREHGSFALEYAAQGLNAGIETQWSGERFDDAANSARLGGYGVINLYATQVLTAEWSLVGRWNNALDKNYTLAQGYATPGSNAYIGLRYWMK